MTVFQFIASIVGSVAWPITVLVIILLLRKHLIRLLSKLTSLKYGDLEAKFDSGLDRAESDLLSLPPVARETIDRDRSATDHILKLQVISATKLPPHLEIIEAWRAVERELRNYAESRGIRAASTTPLLLLLRVLSNKEYLNPILISLINELRTLRNFASHAAESDQITPEQARRYLETTAQVIQQLHALRQR